MHAHTCNRAIVQNIFSRHVRVLCSMYMKRKRKSVDQSWGAYVTIYHTRDHLQRAGPSIIGATWTKKKDQVVLDSFTATVNHHRCLPLTHLLQVKMTPIREISYIPDSHHYC